MNVSDGSTSLDRSASLLRQLKVAYEDADTFSREVGNFRQDVVIPAHNELRYAGYHLLEGLEPGEAGLVLDEADARRAIGHCHRSVYEAADAGIISALDQIAQFKDDYAKVEITPVVDDYLDILAHARDAQTLIAEKRKHKDDDDGKILHEDYRGAFRSLVKDCVRLDIARDELNKRIAARQDAGRKFVLTALLTLLGIVVTIAVGVSQI